MIIFELEFRYIMSIFFNTKNGDNMKKILFTGARSGIAKATIDQLKNQDYYIYATVENEKQLEAMQRIYGDDNNVESFVLDVTKREDRNKVESLDIDILVCNAALSYGGSLTEIDVNLVRDTYEVNVFSSLELIQVAFKMMMRKKEGKIIIMSSLAGIYPIPFIGSYASSKASLIKMAEILKKEIDMLDVNIDVCLILPGFYYTGFNQVMFENKYSSMNIDSYFKSQIEILRNRESFIHNFIEKKKLDSIVRKILVAINNQNCKFLYRAPLSQVVFTKLYSLCKE